MKSASRMKQLRRPADRRHLFLNCPIDDFTLREMVELANQAIVGRERLQQTSLNVAKLVQLRSDPILKRDVEQSDVIGADGMGIVWGCRMLGIPLPERVAGVDLMEALLRLSARQNFKPYILGAKREVLERAILKLTEKMPRLTFAGYHDGYFRDEEEASIVTAIRNASPDILFVAMPTPRKENFLHRYRNDLHVPVVMGVGGSVDVFAGHVSRAPKWMRRCGLEWLYRLVQEPGRMWRRYLVTNTCFAGLMVTALIRRAIRLARRDMSVKS